MKITRALGGVPLGDAELQRLQCGNEDARAVLARALARMDAEADRQRREKPGGGPPVRR